MKWTVISRPGAGPTIIGGDFHALAPKPTGLRAFFIKRDERRAHNDRDYFCRYWWGDRGGYDLEAEKCSICRCRTCGARWSGHNEALKALHADPPAPCTKNAPCPWMGDCYAAGGCWVGECPTPDPCRCHGCKAEEFAAEEYRLPYTVPATWPRY